MELTGEKVINASQARVYEALHDPVLLRQALPGVETLTMERDGRYHIGAALRVGPLRPVFTGTIEIYNEDEPAGYSLRGQVRGGGAGTVTGNAHVALARVHAHVTNLAYHLTADVTGQIGAREGVRLDATVRSLLDEFFSRLQLALEREAATLPASETTLPVGMVAMSITAPASTAATDATGASLIVPSANDIAFALPRSGASPATARGAHAPQLYAAPEYDAAPYSVPVHEPATGTRTAADLIRPSARVELPSITDAMGARASDAPLALPQGTSASATRDPTAYPGVGSGPYQPQSFAPLPRDAPIPGATVSDGTGHGPGRWLSVAVGIALIGLLLSGRLTG